jgi:hypothetical protein
VKEHLPSDQRLSLNDRAHAYKERAFKRFQQGHKCDLNQSCDFCAGWTWGAVDGYKAAARAAKRNRK